MGRAERAAARALALAIALLGPGALGAEEAAPDRPGAALRAALEARRGGRLDEAAAGFERVEKRWPVVGDHAARLALEVRAEAGAFEAVRSGAVAFAERYPDSRLRPRVARLRGDAAAALGAGGEARAAWREALAGSEAADERVRILLALAGSEQAAGEVSAARSDFLEAWLAAPGSAEAETAEGALDALERSGAVPPRDADAWSRRAEALSGAGLHDRAVAALDRALALGPGPPLRDALLRQRAFALFRARRYPEAAAAFEAFGGGAEGRFWQIRALARSGDLDGAIGAFEDLGEGSSAYAPRARLLAATLLEDDPTRRERAAALYASVADASGAQAELRREARWRLGWLRYRGDRPAEAAAAFARLAADEDDPIDALRPRYFALRARERAAPAEAGAIAADYARLADDYPLSYYGWRASLRSPANAPPAAPRPPAPPLGAPDLAGVPVARIEILLEAGLLEEADAEVEALAPAARSDADRAALAAWALAAENARLAAELVSAGRAEELARGPVPGREPLWRLAWPRAYAAEVEGVAAADGVPPELVFAIMREESSFRPRALSPVGARGLLQLMPETAGRLALELGLDPPLPDALYTPGLNVRLGTHLLGNLLRQFAGRTSAAIAGYNAGAAAVGRWLDGGGGLADDEWVEAIPYDETRAYVRRVLRSLHAYRVLY